MNYIQIRNIDVMNAIYKGYNVVICLFDENKILYTDDLTVAVIRNYTTITKDIAFFKVEGASA